VRVDYNTPLTKDKPRKVADDARIAATLPTLRHLIERGARIVLGSHLGRPGRRVKPSYSLEPVALRLAELPSSTSTLADEPVGRRPRCEPSTIRAPRSMRWRRVGRVAAIRASSRPCALVLGQRGVVVDPHEHPLAVDRDVGDVLDPGRQRH